jgi:hypothetical protein
MTTDHDFNAETASLCKVLFERCQADDVEGAKAAVRSKIGPENAIWEASFNALLFARSWEARNGLLRLDEESLRREATSRYPKEIEEWACVSVLLNTHIERRRALSHVSDPAVPERVRTIARSIIWGAVYAAIVDVYPWLAEPVAEIETQRLIGYTATPMAFFESLVEGLAAAMNGRLGSGEDKLAEVAP